jgi:uncharacterized protein with ParB-like and HNH nuclease domain/predicted transport protein
MKATEAKLLKFLKDSQQFIIPIYQRNYSWTESECQQLWDDILRVGKNDEVTGHFIGSIVYIEKGLYQVSNQSPLLVIDGQQRITTVTLILEALARYLSSDEPVEGFSAKKIRSYYLINPMEQGEKEYKLLLTQTDNNTLKALVKQKSVPNDGSVRVNENFEFFKSKIEKCEDIRTVCLGISKLLVVDISLNKDQDNPQLIFESMNSTGRELTQADLIRNFVLMDLEPEHQKSLYEDYWRPMELLFGQESYNKYFDQFMRHYLTVKTRVIPKENEVYWAFKNYYEVPKIKSSGIDLLVEELYKFSEYYSYMAFGKEQAPELESAFKDLRELVVDVSYPFLLELYGDYENKLLAAEDLEKIVRLIESYVFRRAVCSIPTNSLNKTFATICNTIDKDNYLESTLAQFMLLPSYRRFPNDEEFINNFKTRNLYSFKKKNYWLRKIENCNRKERVEVGEYTVEHILPQNKKLSTEWQNDLGIDWKEIQEQYLHTLGNLTLTGYNSEYSDKPFIEKRDMKGGFKESPLKLNDGLGEIEKWDANAICKRAENLAKKAKKIWEYPIISTEILEKHTPEKDVITETNYSLSDHPKLIEGSQSRIQFEALRKKILSIDPCVSEVILKRYIAYKAETNFVDIIPQTNKLRLNLNMSYYQLHDPQGIARDITDVGRWGNGDVSVHLDSIEQIPYIMGLIQQSYDSQMCLDVV